MNRSIKKASIFIGLTFLINYILIILYLASGNQWSNPASFIVTVIYMFIPMLITIVVQKLIYGESLRGLGIYFRLNWWFFVAWLLPPIIALITLGISLLFPGIEYSPELTGFLEQFKSVLPSEELKQLQSELTAVPTHYLVLTSVIQGLIAGATINAVFGFGEELGWRGLLQTELNFMGFWKSSAIIGLTWGLWHAPLILQGHNYPQHPKIGVLMMTIFTLLLSPIFSYIRIKSKSVIAAAVMHGTLNGMAALPILVINGGNDLTVGITGLAGLTTLVLIIISLFVYDRFLAKESIMLS